MASWGTILKELNDTQAQSNIPPYDTVRRKYLRELANHTKRNVILYATSWTQLKPYVGQEQLSINEQDIQGFMEATQELSREGLDIISVVGHLTS